jgi:hypothetical protein
MRIEYKFGYFDYLRFTLVQQFMSPILNGVVVLFVGYVFVSALSDNSLAVSFFVALFWYATMWSAQALILALYLFSRRADSMLTEHVLEIRDDALYESTKFNESRFFWPGVLKVVSRPGYVAIFIAQHAAHVVPNRAFASKDQRNEFIATLKAKTNAV